MSQGWQDIQAEVLRRIQTREWPPGTQIPKEQELADSWGCARATVNRALQGLAEDGWLERRRRAGTRVALSPQRRAQMVVPILRQEIEKAGKTYEHWLLHTSRSGLADLCVHTLHLASGLPYAVEDRVINLNAVPAAADQDFAAISANEWLVQNAPFDHGTMEYAAAAAGTFEATHLGCDEGTPLLVLHRETFSETEQITQVRTAFAPHHHVRLEI